MPYGAVPAGVIGALIYHVITDWKSFRGRWIDALKIWEGGLGIWGAVALGVAVGLWRAKKLGLSLPTMLDVVAPAIPLAHRAEHSAPVPAIGRDLGDEVLAGVQVGPEGVQIGGARHGAGHADDRDGLALG